MAVEGRDRGMAQLTGAGGAEGVRDARLVAGWVTPAAAGGCGGGLRRRAARK